MMHCYLFIVPAAADLELIILYFPPEHTHSALYTQLTHAASVHRCTLTTLTHTCAAQSNVALVAAVLEGGILGLLARQPSAAQHGHAHTPHLAQHILLAPPLQATSPFKSS